MIITYCPSTYMTFRIIFACKTKHEVESPFVCKTKNVRIFLSELLKG